MTINEIINEQDIENKVAEWKQEVNHKNYEKWCKTFAAFANCGTGKFYFGIDDDDNVIGLSKDTIKDDTLYINQICAAHLSPQIKYDFNLIPLDNDLYVLEATIYKNENTPVWLHRTDEEEVVYIRRFGESVIATHEELEKLVLDSKRQAFDTQVSNIKYEDASFNQFFNKFQEQLDTDIIPTLKVLQSKKMVTTSNYLTNAGLLFADGPNNLKTNISCRIWPSKSKGSSKMLDRKMFSGNIIEILDFAINYIKLYTKSGLNKNSTGRNNLVSYPDEAIKEALVNAIAHRDYYITGSQIDIDIFVDRIEISSPGSFLLPGNAQDYSLRHIPSTRRNEAICDVFDFLQLMEQSGTGFDKICDIYDKYDKKYYPEVYSDPAHFVITLKDLYHNVDEENKIVDDEKLIYQAPKTGTREYDNMILNYCYDEPKSRKEIMEFIGISHRNHFAYDILNPLLDNNLLLTTQKAIKAPNQKYYTNTKIVKK